MFMTPKNTFSIKYIEIVQRHGSGYKVFKRTICFIIKSSYRNVEDKQIFTSNMKMEYKKNIFICLSLLTG